MVVIDEKDIEERLENVRNQKYETQLRLEQLKIEESEIEMFLRVLKLYAKPVEPPILRHRESHREPNILRRRNARKEIRKDIRKRQPGYLKRTLLDMPQNQVAREIIRNFGPGEIITAHALAQKTDGQIEHPHTSGSYTHWLSSFLNKEAQCMNGVLERIEGRRGHYRVKEDPEQFLR